MHHYNSVLLLHKMVVITISVIAIVMQFGATLSSSKFSANWCATATYVGMVVE